MDLDLFIYFFKSGRFMWLVSMNESSYMWIQRKCKYSRFKWVLFDGVLGPIVFKRTAGSWQRYALYCRILFYFFNWNQLLVSHAGIHLLCWERLLSSINLTSNCKQRPKKEAPMGIADPDYVLWDTVRVYCGVWWFSPWVACLWRRFGTSSSFQTQSYQHSLPLGRTCAGSLRERGRQNTVRIMGDNVSYLTPWVTLFRALFMIS